MKGKAFNLPRFKERQTILGARRSLKMARSAHAYVCGNTRKFFEWLETAAGPPSPPPAAVPEAKAPEAKPVDTAPSAVPPAKGGAAPIKAAVKAAPGPRPAAPSGKPAGKPGGTPDFGY